MFFRCENKITALLFRIIENIIKSILIIPRGACRYHPSCSDYAQEAIKRLPLHAAILKISIRILKCNPFFKGGYDPVVKDSRKAQLL